MNGESVSNHENAIGLPINQAPTSSNISVKACWAEFDALRLMILEAAITLPVLVIVSVILRHKNKESRCCYGLAGVAYPWDCLKYAEGRAQCVLTICLLTFPAYLLISESTAIFDIIPDESWLKTPLELAAILAAGLSLHPILLSATMPSVLTHFVALIVAATQTTIAILPLALCVQDIPLSFFVVPILYLLPSILAGLALIVTLLYKCIKLIKSRRQFLPSVSQELPEAFLIEKAEYVRKLLRKHKNEKNAEEKHNAVKRVYEKLKNKIRYTPTTGFYFPLTLQCSFVSSLILLYFMVLKAISATINLATILNQLSSTLFNALNNSITVQQAFADNVQDGHLKIDQLLPFSEQVSDSTILMFKYLLDCFLPIAIASISLAAINGLAVLTFIFVNYKQNVLQAYAGNYGHFTHRTQLEPLHALIGLCQYGGYQVGYTAWAAILQFVAYLVLLAFVWYTVLLPICFGFDLWFVAVISQYWPMIVIAVAHEVLQFSVTRFAFAAHKGKWLGVRNSKLFQVWSYYSFITNCIMGLVSCLLRLIVAFVVSFVFLARLDWCNLPPKFRCLDNGHFAYMGQLHTDVCHSHPILITFIELLKKEAKKTKSLGRTSPSTVVDVTSASAPSQNKMWDDHKFKAYSTLDEVSATDSSADVYSTSFRRKNYRIKWLVAYAKVCNPALQQVCKWNREK